MLLTDDVMVLMAKERMEEAMGMVARARALRHAGVLRQPLRVRLGAVMIRIGRGIGGQSLTEASSTLESVP
jgi:hypothetical protein